MKKLIALFIALAFACSTSFATTISRPNNYTAGTVIDPTQVNNNETTIYNDYNGSIDSTNIKANGVNFSNLSTQVQQLWSYRRPVLQYVSATTVNIEAGLNGTSGQGLIIFPDGTFRTDSTATHITLDVSRVASLSGTKQSGLRTGTVANNTWYAVYAVKATDNSTDFVAVADTVLPVQANFSTLNSNFGASGWIYLGMIRYGDSGATGNAILAFSQTGNMTIFRNTGTGGNAFNSNGILLATTGSLSTISYTITFGTSGTQIPSNITSMYLASASAGGATKNDLQQNSIEIHLVSGSGILSSWVGPNSLVLLGGAPGFLDLWLRGYVDSALGVGPNPQF